jgi:hypothetical protein
MWLARPSAHPWALALAVALPLTAVYLIISPPAGDLAAATYRSALFGRVGFTTWDTGWYAAHGHWLPGYSLLSPALGWLLGVHLLLVVSAIAACVLFGMIARHVFDGTAARIAAISFAAGFCVELLSGRVPYDLGFAIGLGAVLALIRGAARLALALAVVTSVASPVAGAFLALAGLAYAVVDARRGLAVMAAALAPIVVLSLVFPEGGYEPFAPSVFWTSLAGVLLIALLLPQGPLSARGRRIVRAGAALYALALVSSFVIATPVGGNAARLGPTLAAPLLAGVLWEQRRCWCTGSSSHRSKTSRQARETHRRAPPTMRRCFQSCGDCVPGRRRSWRCRSQNRTGKRPTWPGMTESRWRAVGTASWTRSTGRSSIA